MEDRLEPEMIRTVPDPDPGRVPGTEEALADAEQEQSWPLPGCEGLDQPRNLSGPQSPVYAWMGWDEF